MVPSIEEGAAELTRSRTLEAAVGWTKSTVEPAETSNLEKLRMVLLVAVRMVVTEPRWESDAAP